MNSCTETWDEHYDAGSMLSYNGTTMQAISEKASDFAKVIKAYGYDRELASDNVYTIWAPANGTFNVSDYVDANGNMVADSLEVVREFIMNHMARYAYSYDNKDKVINLANEKPDNMTADGKFGAANMTNTNIACSNGVLHIVDQVVAYKPNLFELIAKAHKAEIDDDKDSSSLYAFLYDPRFNKDSLIENKSVSAGVDENGEKIWVDSFTLRNNTLLRNVDATLYEEDSSFIAIIPSSKAWRERRKIAESLLDFHPIEDARTAGACDSLKEYYSNMFAMTDLFYNQNANEHWQDSLKSTNYKKHDWQNNVYYSKQPKDMPDDKEINDILSKCGTRMDCSNGYGFVVDQYPFSEFEQFFKRIKVSGHPNNLDRTTDNNGNPAYTKNVNTNFRTYSGTHALYSYNEDSTEVTRKDAKYNYIDVEPNNQSSNISVAFKIPNTLSGEYDIYLITHPIWMSQENRLAEKWDARPYRFYTYIYERKSSGNDMGLYPSTGTRLANPDGSGNYFITKGLEYDAEGFPMANDTTYIGSYTFEHAYYGRNEEGVLIQFQSQVTSRLTSEYSREMLINSIILKPRATKPEADATEAKKNNYTLTINKKD